MTAKERKQVETLQRNYHAVRQVALTAIGCMEHDAMIFGTMRECGWMSTVDPGSTGPKMVCDCSARHLEKLAADLKARMEAV